MTVLTLNIHHKGDRGREVPVFMRAIFFGFLSKVFCMPLQKPAHLSGCEGYTVQYRLMFCIFNGIKRGPKVIGQPCVDPELGQRVRTTPKNHKV